MRAHDRCRANNLVNCRQTRRKEREKRANLRMMRFAGCDFLEGRARLGLRQRAATEKGAEKRRELARSCGLLEFGWSFMCHGSSVAETRAKPE